MDSSRMKKEVLRLAYVTTNHAEVRKRRIARESSVVCVSIFKSC